MNSDTSLNNSGLEGIHKTEYLPDIDHVFEKRVYKNIMSCTN